MTASKAFAAVAAFALALPMSALAAPAFASTPNNSTKAVSVPVVFAESEGDDEGDHKSSGKDSESGHHENHHQIPPVVIRPKDDNKSGSGHKDDNQSEGDDNESEDGDDDGGGFVIPGPVPTGAPTPNLSNSGSPAPAPGSTDFGNQGNTDTTGFGQTRSYNVSPVGGVSQGSSIEPAEANRGALNPEAAPPVDIAHIQTSGKTPADVFMESATIALTALGIGAVAMGGVASTRAIRVRRNPKGDYFYDGDK